MWTCVLRTPRDVVLDRLLGIGEAHAVLLAIGLDRLDLAGGVVREILPRTAGRFDVMNAERLEDEVEFTLEAAEPEPVGGAEVRRGGRAAAGEDEDQQRDNDEVAELEECEEH